MIAVITFLFNLEAQVCDFWGTAYGGSYFPTTDWESWDPEMAMEMKYCSSQLTSDFGMQMGRLDLRGGRNPPGTAHLLWLHSTSEVYKEIEQKNLGTAVFHSKGTEEGFWGLPNNVCASWDFLG